jgi:DNA polymerase-3 subunit epsilon
MATYIGGLDIETTGLSQTDGHRIVEISLVIYNLDTEKEVGRFESRINPQRGIDAKAEAVHGISYGDLVDKPLWESVAPKLAVLMGKCKYVVAHNGLGFDAPFVWGEFVRVGAPMPTLGLVDTMLQGRWATPDGVVPNLGALCFACGVDYDKSKAHGAGYDVEVMMACFFSQYKKGFFSLPGEYYKFEPMKEKK